MRKIQHFLSKIGLIFATASVILLAGCGATDTGGNPATTDNQIRTPKSALALIQPQSCSAFKDYVSASLIKRYTTIPDYAYYGCNKIGGIAGSGPSIGGTPEVAADNGNITAPPSATLVSGPDDVSQTNNQEAGVNESDRVKTDPQTGTVFIAHSRYLLIADAFPPQNMSMMQQIDMGAEVIDLLYDDSNRRLTVITQYSPPYIYYDTGGVVATDPVPGIAVSTIDSLIAPQATNPDEAVASFFDVSAMLDTKTGKPVLLKQISIDGYYQTSRRIDNRVHMVTRHELKPTVLTEDPAFQKLYSAFNQAISDASCNNLDSSPTTASIKNNPAVIAAQEKLAAKITAVVDNIDVNSFLPQASTSSSTGKVAIDGFLQCSDVYHPKVKSRLGMQVVTSIDTNGDNIAASAIVNNSWLTYVSKDGLYISENSNNWWWGNNDDNIDQTVIHKFSISAQRPAYLATGEIDGHANNSYHFSEYKGFLRVATTQRDRSVATPEQPWLSETKNHMSILADDNAGNLGVVGQVRDLAIGETIQSVRFMGDKGFMVTFRNVDPLFAFDLSDPLKPISKGILKIPGFSTYMHPYDDNHLLTIGRAGGANGLGTSNDVQLQLIDISDLSNPNVIAKYSPTLTNGYSWSAASYDPHAFTFYKPANMLVIPMQINAYRIPGQSFSGMIAFDVSLGNGSTSANISEIARIDHSDLAWDFYCNTNGIVAPEYDWACTNDGYIGWAYPRRAIVMTQAENMYLYTISDIGMKAGSINNKAYAPIEKLIFPPQVYPWAQLARSGSPVVDVALP
ncbi:MAG: beta-propeller domain-containing protein [Thiohalomonadales bacterium]